MLIFSVFQKCYTREQNEQQHQGIVRWLKRIGVHFKEGKGTYQGEEELCFSVHDNDEPTVRLLCQQFEQECFLGVSKNKGFFVYTSGPLAGKEIYGGVFTPGKGFKGDYTEIDGVTYHLE